jgi:hypothetical protein
VWCSFFEHVEMFGFGHGASTVSNTLLCVAFGMVRS